MVEQNEPVLAGPHEVATFRPRFTFTTAGKEPARASVQTDRLLVLQLQSPRQLVFARPDKVYLYGGASPTLGAAPNDLKGWVESNPNLKVVGRSQTSVGGKTAHVVDVQVTSVPGEKVGGCFIPCLPLVPLGIGDHSVFLANHQKARFVFVATASGSMFILVPSSEPDFKKDAQAAAEFLKTVHF